MLIGVLALIFLGPRRMPEMARKLGKIMQEFRGTANEFKETWQREVDLSEEAKALDINSLETEAVARVETITVTETVTVAETSVVEAPQISAADPEAFKNLTGSKAAQETEAAADDVNDRKNWL